MFECPHNPGVRADACQQCTPNCGFAPHEIARRKARINEGKGLTKKANGLRYLKIKRRK